VRFVIGFLTVPVCSPSRKYLVPDLSQRGTAHGMLEQRLATPSVKQHLAAIRYCSIGWSSIRSWPRTQPRRGGAAALGGARLSRRRSTLLAASARSSKCGSRTVKHNGAAVGCDCMRKAGNGTRCPAIAKAHWLFSEAQRTSDFRLGTSCTYRAGESRRVGPLTDQGRERVRIESLAV
jgi:hypothetical protein